MHNFPFPGKTDSANLCDKEAVTMDTAALLLTIIGALNWGLVALFRFDLVAWIGGGQGALVSRIIYGLVALAGIWCITLLFRDRRMAVTD